MIGLLLIHMADTPFKLSGPAILRVLTFNMLIMKSAVTANKGAAYRKLTELWTTVTLLAM